MPNRGYSVSFNAYSKKLDSSNSESDRESREVSTTRTTVRTMNPGSLQKHNRPKLILAHDLLAPKCYNVHNSSLVLAQVHGSSELSLPKNRLKRNRRFKISRLCTLVEPPSTRQGEPMENNLTCDSKGTIPVDRTSVAKVHGINILEEDLRSPLTDGFLTDHIINACLLIVQKVIKNAYVLDSLFLDLQTIYANPQPT